VKRGLEATLKVGFDWKEVENRILGVVSGEDDLRIVNTGINIEQTDSDGRTISPHTVYFGLGDALGGSGKDDDTTTTPGASGDFVIYRGSLLRQQNMGSVFGERAFLLMKSSWQVTGDQLPAVEQIRLGGAYSVRGYEENEYLGDFGTHGGVEIHMPLGSYFVPIAFPKHWKSPFSNKPLNEEIHVVLFADGGYAGINVPLPGESERRYMLGVGGGVRVHLAERFYARFEWARPVAGDKPLDSQDTVFYFGISTEIF
jgi:hemolysin activation/secretion protein